MRSRRGALALLASIATLTALAIAGPTWAAVLLAFASLAAMRARRLGFLAFAGSAVAINAAILGLVDGWPHGVAEGVVGGTRLAAAAGVSLAALSWISPARMLEALRLPPRATALLGAVVLSAHDVGRDFERLRTARRLEGAWPARRIARVRAAAGLVAPLLLAAHRRAQTRRDALRLAGHDVQAWFVPVVAIAALAAAGRMAFLALPNVALTYVVVFLGGVLWGPLAAMAGAALGMALTDFLLSGLYPLGFVNVPAMALLGLCGGALRGFDFAGDRRSDRLAGVVFAAFFGLAGTLLFSVAADATTWALLYRDAPGRLVPLVVAGLAFNAIPAVVNALLFAVSVVPTARAFRAAQRSPSPPGPPQARPAPEQAPPALP